MTDLNDAEIEEILSDALDHLGRYIEQREKLKRIVNDNSSTFSEFRATMIGLETLRDCAFHQLDYTSKAFERFWLFSVQAIVGKLNLVLRQKDEVAESLLDDIYSSLQEAQNPSEEDPVIDGFDNEGEDSLGGPF